MIRTLKLLIDTLFWILCLGLVGFFFVLPFGIFTTKIADVSFEGFEGYRSLPVLYWVGMGLAIVTYIVFLVAINYLRRTMNHFISSSTYSVKISENLRRGGILFIISAVTLAFTYLLFWGIDVSKGNIKLILGTDIMVPIFLSIVGLFFVLQSKVLDQARLLKEDSNLTI